MERAQHTVNSPHGSFHKVPSGWPCTIPQSHTHFSLSECPPQSSQVSQAHHGRGPPHSVLHTFGLSLVLWQCQPNRAEDLFLLSAQHLLRVAYQDPSTGCTSKTLAVPPGSSIATLSQLCATKFRVTQPDAFGLFLYKDQGYHRLPPDALDHRLPATGYLIYRRAERPETQGAVAEKAKTGSKGPEAGAWEEETGGLNREGKPRIAVDQEGKDQARGGHIGPEEQKAEGSQALEE